MNLQRLAQDRKNWRKNPLPDFYARPRLSKDGSADLTVWDAGIPGVVGTDWENGIFTIVIEFPEDYPALAPKVKFSPVIYHPNVFSSGAICLSLLNADWRPGVTLSEFLMAIQRLLSEPNANHVTDRTEPSTLYKKDRRAYDAIIRSQTAKFIPKPIERSDEGAFVGEKRAVGVVIGSSYKAEEKKKMKSL